jgi:hypothetical protein
VHSLQPHMSHHTYHCSCCCRRCCCCCSCCTCTTTVTTTTAAAHSNRLITSEAVQFTTVPGCCSRASVFSSVTQASRPKPWPRPPQEWLSVMSLLEAVLASSVEKSGGWKSLRGCLWAVAGISTQARQRSAHETTSSSRPDSVEQFSSVGTVPSCSGQPLSTALVYCIVTYDRNCHSPVLVSWVAKVRDSAHYMQNDFNNTKQRFTCAAHGGQTCVLLCGVVIAGALLCTQKLQFVQMAQCAQLECSSSTQCDRTHSR